MSIAGIAQTSPCAPALAETPPPEGPSTEDPQVVPQQDPPAPDPTGGDEPAGPEAQAVPPEGSEQGDGEAKGVLRLLMAGHFKGVADVRLRINFHDELVAAETAAAKPATSEAVTELANTINAQLDEALSSEGLDQEQQSALTEAQGAFNEAVSSASEIFLGAAVLEGGALRDNLREAFELLMGTLESLLVTEAPEQPEEPPPAEGAEETPPAEGAEEPPPAEGAEEPPPVEGVEDPPPAEGVEDPPPAEGAGQTQELQEPLEEPPEEPVQGPIVTLLAGLRETFEAAMLELNEVLSSSSLLPALSPAPGNGVAYEKFLAIYNELRAPAGADETGAEQVVDVGA